MKLNYDGLNVTFTPETDEDQKLLVGFANLDAVSDKYVDSNSFERLHILTADSMINPVEAIEFLSACVADDTTFDDPPEDEDDDDEIPTPIMGSGI